MEYTKEYIREMLLTNDHWLCRGIVAIYERQTANEKETQTTRESNGVGFNGLDAKLMSSFAEQIKTRNWLSDKQKTLARRMMPKYAGQLEKIANKKI